MNVSYGSNFIYPFKDTTRDNETIDNVTIFRKFTCVYRTLSLCQWHILY